MATQPEHDDPNDAPDQEAETQGQQAETGQEAGGDDDELIVEIEGEEPDTDNAALRATRAHIKRLEEDNRRLREGGNRKLPTELGKKPDLWEDCEGDPDKFEAAITEWHETKRSIEAEKQRAESQTREQRQVVERNEQRARSDAARKGIKNYEQAEQAVADALSPQYLGFIYQYADKPAELVAGLARAPSKLAEIEAEQDPVRRMIKLRDMEGKLKISNRKAPPPPEAPDNKRGGAPIVHQSSDKKLEQLRTEAEKSGDYSRLAKYKADLRTSGRPT